jgi:hypothetical protein
MELRFCKRLWKFDYAIPEKLVAVEIEGGVYVQGRHTRGQGYIKDMEKYNAAIELGWVVLRYTPYQKFYVTTIEQIKAVAQMR